MCVLSPLSAGRRASDVWARYRRQIERSGRASAAPVRSACRLSPDEELAVAELSRSAGAAWQHGEVGRQGRCPRSLPSISSVSLSIEPRISAGLCQTRAQWIEQWLNPPPTRYEGRVTASHQLRRTSRCRIRSSCSASMPTAVFKWSRRLDSSSVVVDSSCGRSLHGRTPSCVWLPVVTPGGSRTRRFLQWLSRPDAARRRSVVGQSRRRRGCVRRLPANDGGLPGRPTRVSRQAPSASIRASSPRPNGSCSCLSTCDAHASRELTACLAGSSPATPSEGGGIANHE